MKTARKLVFCLFVTVLISAFSYLLVSSDIFDSEKPAVFETGDYQDYYYLNLTETQKQAYTAVRKNIGSFPAEIEVPELDSDSLTDVLTAVICDDPMLFMFNSCTVVTKGNRHYFVPEYRMNIDTYLQVQNKVLTAVNSILANLPDNLSALKLEEYLHDSIVNSCTYSETDTYSESTVEGVFVDGKAKCSGYAKAFKLLLNKAGIESVLVSGTATDYNGKSSSHMWNAVELNANWYFTDITWDDPVSDNGEEYCRHIYFNMTDEMLSRTHSDYSFLHSCSDASLYYYISEDTYYYDYNNSTRDKMAEKIAQAADEGLEDVQFMFASDTLFDTASTSLFEGEEIYTLLDRADKMTQEKLLTDSVRYQADSDTRLITIIIETR